MISSYTLDSGLLAILTLIQACKMLKTELNLIHTVLV